MLVLGLAQEQTDTVLGGWMTEGKLALKEGWNELGPKNQCPSPVTPCNTDQPFDWISLFCKMGC